MGEYTGLDGVKGGSIRPRGRHMARTVSGLMELLRKGRVCSAASDNGAVTVWKADNGQYHCDFGRFRSSIDHQTFITKKAVRVWLREWLPKIERNNSPDGGNERKS